MTVTKLAAKKHRGDCEKCYGVAEYVVKEEGKRPRKLCFWCVRPYREDEG